MTVFTQTWARTAGLFALLTAGLACGSEPTPGAPDLPRIADVASPTNQPFVLLRGTKPSATSLFINGERVLPLSDDVVFSIEVPLVEGGNQLNVVCEDARGERSGTVTIGVTVDTQAPIAPVVEPVVARTVRANVEINGTKPVGAILFTNGVERPETKDAGTFSFVQALALGDNRVRLSTMDDVDNESDVVELRIERTATLPFSVDSPADGVVVDTPTVSFSGTRGARVVVEVAGTVLPAPLSDGPWTTNVALAPGPNPLVVRAYFDGESDLAVQQTIDVTYTPAAPVVTIDAPSPGAAVGNTLSLSGQAFDNEGPVLVEVCIGACAVDADFTSATLVASAWDATLDLSARADLVDGASSVVTVRATDALSLRSTVTVDVVLARTSLATGAPGGTTLSLAAAGGPFDAAWASLVGTDVVLTQELGPPVGDATSVVVSDAGAAATGEPRVTLGLSGTGFVSFAEASARTASADTTRGLLVVPFDDAGPQAPVVVVDASGGDVSAADIALRATGEPVVAFVRGDTVAVSVATAGVFAAPVTVSDATTAAVGDVRLVVGSDDVITVAWLEASARDGTADDVDVVARRFTPGVGADAAVLLVTADTGSFVDAGDDTLALASTGGTAPDDVAVVGTVNAGDAWLFALGGAVPAVTDEVALLAPGTVSAVSLTEDASGVLVALLDDAGAITVQRGAAAVLGAPLVVTTEAASLPAVAAGHVAFVDSRGVVLRALVESP